MEVMKILWVLWLAVKSGMRSRKAGSQKDEALKIQEAADMWKCSTLSSRGAGRNRQIGGVAAGQD